MALSTRTILFALPLAHALPVIDDRVRRALGTGDQNGGNSTSPKIIASSMIFFTYLCASSRCLTYAAPHRVVEASEEAAPGRDRHPQRVDDHTSTTTPAATRTQSNTRTQTTTTRTPITAPARDQTRLRVLRDAGDEEIVLVRRGRDDDDNPRNSRISGREHSRSASETPLLDDASPEMGRISLAESSRGRSEGGHDEQSQDQHTPPDPGNDTSISLATAADTTNDSLAPLPEAPETTTTNVPLDDAPPYSEAVRSSQEASGPESSQPQDAEAASSASASASNTAEADALGTLVRNGGPCFVSCSRSIDQGLHLRRCLTLWKWHRLNRDNPYRQPQPQAQQRPGPQTRHRPSASISTLASSSRGHGHTLSPSLSSLLLTRSRSPTRSSDSLAQRYNISAPIPTTLVRTEFSYPRSGPTPEQIRFLSSRESLGRFGMPYGEEAVAAAARSRENLSSMALPPQYEHGPSDAPSETQNATQYPSLQSRTEPALAEPRPASPQPGTASEVVGDERSASEPATDQPERPASASGSAMPINDRRDSMFSTNSFVTAHEGDRDTMAEGREDGGDNSESDSAPPTPTLETYRLADEDTVRVPENTENQADSVQQRPRGQTILIPGSQASDDTHHPQLTFIPATPRPMLLHPSS
ncbi:hypothetical protein RhiJN_12864 [Ceratobasidium sp. AG-Ba]|nr:hypothetical protein RhiJN_12864 [Ceratobasidium sp. AG-Ba]